MGREPFGHGIKGSDGSRYVCLGSEEAMQKAMRLQKEFPQVKFELIELDEQLKVSDAP